MTWCPPSISLRWGAYFKPDADDDAKAVDTAIKARDGKIITLRSAVESVKGTFNIENVDQYLEALEEETAEAMQQQQQMAADMMLQADSGNEGGNDDGQADQPGTPARGNRRGKPRKKGTPNGPGTPTD